MTDRPRPPVSSTRSDAWRTRWFIPFLFLLVAEPVVFLVVRLMMELAKGSACDFSPVSRSWHCDEGALVWTQFPTGLLLFVLVWIGLPPRRSDTVLASVAAGLVAFIALLWPLAYLGPESPLFDTATGQVAGIQVGIVALTVCVFVLFGCARLGGWRGQGIWLAFCATAFAAMLVLLESFDTDEGGSDWGQMTATAGAILILLLVTILVWPIGALIQGVVSLLRTTARRQAGLPLNRER